MDRLIRTILISALLFAAQSLSANEELNALEKLEAKNVLGQVKEKIVEFRTSVDDWLEYANAVFDGDDGRYLAVSNQARAAHELGESYGREFPTELFEKFQLRVNEMESFLGSSKSVGKSKRLQKFENLFEKPKTENALGDIDKSKEPFPTLIEWVSFLEENTNDYLAAVGELQSLVKEAKNTVSEPSTEPFSVAVENVLKTERVKKATAEKEREELLKKTEEEEYARQSKILAEQKKQEMQEKFEREQEEEKVKNAEEARKIQARKKIEHEAAERKANLDALMAKAKDPAYQAMWAVFLADGDNSATNSMSREISPPGPASWKRLNKLIAKGPEDFIECITGKFCKFNRRGYWLPPKDKKQKQEYVEAYEEFARIAPIWNRMGLFQE